MAVTLTPKVKTLINQTGSALEQQGDYESTFAPIETWSVDDFRKLAKLETPFVSKKGNLVCLITRPDGEKVFCGISKSASSVLRAEGFVKSKVLVSVMPATEDFPQGFLMHVAQGAGGGKQFLQEVD